MHSKLWDRNEIGAGREEENLKNEKDSCENKVRKMSYTGQGMTVKAGSPTLKKKKSCLQNPCTWGFLRKPYYKDPLEAVIYFLLSVAAINSTHFKERKKKS